uniref:Uncharacterized protein n=1 Tax=Kalanchoe fedtschenkoi TaxID=63787 RepID=A0A7N0UTY9_KALFE
MSRCVVLSVRRFSTGSARVWNSSTGLMITNPILLKMESCSSMAQLKQIQAQMTVTGLIRDAFPASRVLSFCALSDAGDFGYALALFDRVNDRNVYVWNTMVRGCCRVGFWSAGLGLFREMVRGGVELDQRSFVFGLKACERVLAGNSVHCRVVKVGFDRNLLVMNGLIHFYGEKGETFDARKLFDESPVRDVVCWTSMIDGYAKKGCLEEALDLFERMLGEDVEPNEVTMISVLTACSKKRDLVLGKSIHRYVVKSSFRRNVNLSNALLDMYVKCDCLDAAREVFDRMGVKDTFSWTSLVNGYAKCGQLESARRMFDMMPERNVVSWNAMIAGYSQNNLPSQAIDLFHDMVEAGLDPVEGTLVCVLSACAQSGCLDFGRWMHQFYVEERRVPLSVPLANAFVDMYSNCGDIDAAAAMFDEIPCKDLVSWNSMIVGYASHGYAEEALRCFDQMMSAGIKPDDITFVGVLSACSHGGLVTQGWTHFRNLEPVWGLRPKVEHYACMIDLLGRTGRLKEAYGLMIRMPMEPDIASWGALLNASRMHGNVELGKLAAEKLMVLDPNDSGIYSLLANLCAKRKRWDDVKMVRSMMRERGIKKTPGCSSIAVDSVVHEFLAADESHPQSSAIYEALNQMRLQAKIQVMVDISA